MIPLAQDRPRRSGTWPSRMAGGKRSPVLPEIFPTRTLTCPGAASMAELWNSLFRYNFQPAASPAFPTTSGPCDYLCSDYEIAMHDHESVTVERTATEGSSENVSESTDRDSARKLHKLRA
jgi:hypothetical protein